MRRFVKDYLGRFGEAERLPEAQFNAMFKDLDENGDEQISKGEMKEFIEKVRATEVQEVQEAVAEIIAEAVEEAKQEEAVTKELIDEIWENYDKDHSGALSKAEMRQFVKDYLTRLGEADRLPEAQFNSMFKDLDDNGDG
jgi:Ca2+-binding EF-hand superfamily protein